MLHKYKMSLLPVVCQEEVTGLLLSGGYFLRHFPKWGGQNLSGVVRNPLAGHESPGDRSGGFFNAICNIRFVPFHNKPNGGKK